MPLRELPQPTGPLAERTTEDGRRRLKLNSDEREDLRESLMIDRLVHMILTLDEDSMTYAEMAEELDITVAQLKNLTRTEEFQERYNQHFLQLGQDPRVEVTQSKIVELLPMVFLQMQEGLENPNVPWTAKWNIMEKVLELAGIDKPEMAQNERKEIEEFLLNKSESEDSIQIIIPGKYMETMEKYNQGQTIDNAVGDDFIEGEFNEEDVNPTSD
jgi:hypothetical protein